MKLVKKILSEDFYRAFLMAMNGFLKLTDKEIMVFAEFMEIKNQEDINKAYLSEDLRNEYLFGSVTRKHVQEKLKISPHNLNNYIKSLKDKKVILEFNDQLAINPKVFVLKKDNGVNELIFSFSIEKKA